MKTTIIFLFAIATSVLAFAGNGNQGLASNNSLMERDSVDMADTTGLPSANDMFIILTSIPAKIDLEARDGNFYEKYYELETGKDLDEKVGKYSHPICEDSIRMYKYAAISVSRNVNILFVHMARRNRNLPQDLRQVVVSRDFLGKIKPIDMDEKLPTLTSEEADKFCESLKGKRVWIIDRKDITEDEITLVEATVRRGPIIITI